MSFNPKGDRLATISWTGKSVIFDVNTGAQLFRIDHGYDRFLNPRNLAWIRFKKDNRFNFAAGSSSRCRWNDLEPLIAVKHNENILDLIDIEMQSKRTAFTLPKTEDSYSKQQIRENNDNCSMRRYHLDRMEVQ